MHAARADVLDGAEVALSDRALRVLETSHPRTIYVPPQDFADGILRVSRSRRSCWITSDLRGPFKGAPGTIGW